jgi:hypothetical protein
MRVEFLNFTFESVFMKIVKIKSLQNCNCLLVNSSLGNKLSRATTSSLWPFMYYKFVSESKKLYFKKPEQTRLLTNWISANDTGGSDNTLWGIAPTFGSVGPCFNRWELLHTISTRVLKWRHNMMTVDRVAFRKDHIFTVRINTWSELTHGQN